jgi:hypothetical protein
VEEGIEESCGSCPNPNPDPDPNPSTDPDPNPSPDPSPSPSPDPSPSPSPSPSPNPDPDQELWQLPKILTLKRKPILPNTLWSDQWEALQAAVQLLEFQDDADAARAFELVHPSP